MNFCECVMSDQRKRGRDEEEAEFAPLSKRINNLHLHNSGQNQNHINQHILSHSYCPDLTEAENPHYYRKNKLLYELHLERGRRENQN